MRTVVLCGGRGARLDALGNAVAKALVEIGGYPILWHLMNLYASSGFNDFTLCTGHLGDLIKNYFDRSNENEGTDTSPFSRSSVKIFDTGLDTNTGGRIAKIKDDLESEERFFVTYGDGLSDVDINALLAFHLSHGKRPLTSVRPTSTFGLLDISDEGEVRRFAEKPKLDIWINGGFSYLNDRSSTILMRIRYWNVNRWKSLRMRVNSWRFATTDSGNVWTPLRITLNSTSFGDHPHLGKDGKTYE